MAFAVITREPERAAPYAQALAQLGLTALAMPVTITVEGDPGQLESALCGLRAGDVVALASARAAQLVAAALTRLVRSARAPAELGAIQWWVVGEATAAPLRAHGLVARVAERASARGLAEAILDEHRAHPAHHAGPLRVLLPRAEDGREEAAQALRAAGAAVEELVAYRTAPAAADAAELTEPLARWRGGQVAVAALFAPSQVAALSSLLAAAGLRMQDPAVLYAAIGETTADALRAAGIADLVVAARPTPMELAAAVAGHLRPVT